MSQQKFDLSNVGGQPKDWLSRATEPSSLGFKEYALFAVLFVAGAVTLGGLAILALRLIG